MATRSFPGLSQSNLLKEVRLCVTLKGAGSGLAPTLSTGDPNGAFFSAPVFVSTGIFTITTIDGYPNAPASVGPDYAVASPSATTSVCEGPIATQNATTGAWTFTFNCFTAGSLADPITTSQIHLCVIFSNTNDPFAG